MRKIAAEIVFIVGIVLFVGGLYLIYQIFMITYEVNSQPNPPGEVILFNDVQYCNCDITHGLAWNIVAVLMSLGLIMIAAGIGKYNLVTRKQ